MKCVVFVGGGIAILGPQVGEITRQNNNNDYDNRNYNSAQYIITITDYFIWVITILEN